MYARLCTISEHAAAAAAKATVTTKFVKGDVVLVTEGELVNLLGVVDSVIGDMVKVIPKHEDFQDGQTLDFPEAQLTKYFKIGDHVKVCCQACLLLVTRRCFARNIRNLSSELGWLSCVA